jgi:hypothetical protein
MTDHALRQQLTNLLGAYGYNLYAERNRLRADDLVVRQQAADALAAAGNALRALRTDYRRRFIPPPTRAQPEPPRERLEELSAIARLAERLADLETRIRSMPVPPSDRVWERFRREPEYLMELLAHDYQLVAPCRAVRELAEHLSAATWGAAASAELEQQADAVEQAVRDRAVFLQL